MANLRDIMKKNEGKKSKKSNELEVLINKIAKLVPPAKDGKSPSKEEIIKLIKPLIPVVKNGKDGEDGINGVTPTKGKDYFTPREVETITNGVLNKVVYETGESIKKKLSSLKGASRLDKSSISGLDELIKKATAVNYSGGHGGSPSFGTAITLDTVNFNNNLSSADDTVQKALDTMDNVIHLGGDVTKVGTPVDNQVGVWTGDGTLEGTTELTFDGSDLKFNAFDTGVRWNTASAGGYTPRLSFSDYGDAYYLNGASATYSSFTAPYGLHIYANTDPDFDGDWDTYLELKVTGEVNLVAGKTNQDINLIPSGTGVVKVGVNTILDSASTVSALTTIGTIGTGVWQGTAIDQTYLVGQSGTNTGDQTSIVGITGTVAQFNTAITDATLSGNNTGDNAGLENLVEDTTPQLGGDLDAQANHIGFTQQTITYNVTTTTVDWGSGNKATVTLTGNVGTMAFTNPSKPSNLLLKIVQDATGSRTVTAWDTDIKWAGGTAPTLTTTANGIDIISCYFDGTSYYCVPSLAFA